MKRIGFTCAAAVLFGAGVMAQTQTPAQTSAATNAQGGTTLVSGTAINAELSSSVDSKKAKPGDEVKVRTTEPVKSNGQVVLPKGTQLVGRVTEASARAKGENESALGIIFEKAVLKHGEEVPVNATIQALATGVSPMNSGGAPMDMGPSGGTGAAGGGGMSGGGRSPSAAPSTAGTPSAGGYPSGYPSGTANDTGQPNANAAGGANGGVDASGNLAPNSRGVFGLQGLSLKIPAGNNPQGSLITSTGKNVHLDSGTKILLVTRPEPNTQRPASTTVS